MSEKGLSPRQKMINLMYLVLTALLALNVSAEVLVAFAKIEESIRKSTENIELKSEEIYNKFEIAYRDNPKKVEKWYNIAQEVNHRTDSLFNFIQTLKVKVVQAADGPEGNPEHIEKMDENNVGGQVMILEGNGVKLKEAINEYRDYMLNIVQSIVKDTANSTLYKSIRETYYTGKMIGHGGEEVPWESAMFEHLPLIAVVANMSKIQNDIRNTESDVLNLLHSQVDVGSWKFNKIEAVVVSKKSAVLQGEKYTAQIFIAAYDTTQNPRIVMNTGKILPVKDGKGIFEAVSPVGTHKFGGVIKLKSPVTKDTVDFPFEGEYQVVAPSACISATKMNVFYIGVKNPVAINASGVSPSDIVVSISNGKIVPVDKAKGKYYVMVKRGSESIVTVKTKDGKVLGKMKFRVKRLPSPRAALMASNDKELKFIRKRDVGKLSKVVATYGEEVNFSINVPIISYDITIPKGEYSVQIHVKGSKIPAKAKDQIKRMRVPNRIFIENIKVRMPGGEVRELPLIALKVVN